MKILHITEKPRFSGAEILIRDLALSHVINNTVAITSINPTEDDFKDTMQLLKNEGVKLFIPDTSLSKFQRLSFLFKVFKNFQPDVVVGHSAVVSAYMRIIGVFFPNIKKVVVLHAAADYEGSRRLQNAEYIIQYFTDYVIGVSDWSRNTYKNRFTKVPCKTIFNGVDFTKFDSKYKQYRNKTRSEIFDVNENDFVILQVGRINKVKNQLLTLKAISLLDDEKKENIKIIFAGIIEDKSYYDDMMNFIVSNGLTQNVKFLGARSDVNKLLYAANLYVMPSERENFSIAILEALSTGIPTIYSDISQFEFLEKYDYKNTYKFKLKDLKAYNEIIANIFIDKTPFIDRKLDTFSFEKCSKQYLDLFEHITK